jgi:ABC-type phosphate/phosphonate transport system permease subunit
VDGTRTIPTARADRRGGYLSEMIRVLEWREAAFLILRVLVTGAAIDAISRRLRAAIMGVRGS